MAGDWPHPSRFLHTGRLTVPTRCPPNGPEVPVDLPNRRDNDFLQSRRGRGLRFGLRRIDSLRGVRAQDGRDRP